MMIRTEAVRVEAKFALHLSFKYMYIFFYDFVLVLLVLLYLCSEEQEGAVCMQPPAHYQAL